MTLGKVPKCLTRLDTCDFNVSFSLMPESFFDHSLKCDTGTHLGAIRHDTGHHDHREDKVDIFIPFEVSLGIFRMNGWSTATSKSMMTTRKNRLRTERIETFGWTGIRGLRKFNEPTSERCHNPSRGPDFLTKGCETIADPVNTLQSCPMRED